MITLSTSTPKARKEHKCNFCSGIIQKGEVYDNQTNVYDNKIYNWRTHQDCSKIASELNMYEMGGDEGLTGDDFEEFINEAFSCIEATEGPIKAKDFDERLEIVIKYHLKKK